ncbi:hypothetical protein MTR_1g053630 [Medicago truncatula]|uniref:Uncharacterized protein n=1 Tax=Medicago truncatula TaxID=3880 RepID=A0A072VI22_MEDTR|nr:hypothetical protein MTR_1g053630 [Medicago truncatula]
MILDKSTDKAITESQCFTYKGNQQVKEANANHLEDEDIETMYSKFQTLVSSLQVQRKIYNVHDMPRRFLGVFLPNSE